MYGKLVDKSLSDYDYTELSQYVYGKEYAPDVCRRLMYGSRFTLDLVVEELKKGVHDTELLADIDQKIIELKKERQKLFDQRTAFNKLVRERARQEELNEIITDAIKHGDLVDLQYHPVDIAASNNDLLVSLNDIHYGADIKNAWCEYNSDICRQMMCNYANEIIKIADTHNSENCIITSAGDLISGAIHYSIAVTNKENVIDQIKGVSELIAQFIDALHTHFKTVRFISIAGNHSRMSPNKDNALKDERMDDLVDWYLSARLQNYDNVIIDTESKMDTTMAVFELRGKNYCLVHGDYDGSASKVQALQTMAQRPLYAVLSGHMHHNSTNEVQGIKTLMGGSMSGIDDYCVQKRIYGHPSQMVSVVDDTGIRCSYDIDLTIT